MNVFSPKLNEESESNQLAITLIALLQSLHIFCFADNLLIFSYGSPTIFISHNLRRIQTDFRTGNQHCKINPIDCWLSKSIIDQL